MIRCPNAIGDEIVVCSRATTRDKFLLPLPSMPEPGERQIQNVPGERLRLANIHKWDEPNAVGYGGQYGYTLHMVAEAAAAGTFVPLHQRFGGPDVEYSPPR